MKKQYIILSLLSLLTATNCFAVDIYNGKIIKHKQWTTGEAKAIFHETKDMNDQSTSIDDTVSMTSSDVGTVQGVVGKPVEIKSNHYSYLVNHTDKAQSFHYTMGTCAVAANHKEHCAYYFDEVKLQPKGYLTKMLEPTLSLTFDKPGTYDLYAFTDLGGHDKSNTKSVGKIVIKEEG